ncbi:MAG TPA: phosphate ABC transporter permease subunit PstC [Thermomicrobiales bacterium]|nr:phosphate ABC transporter permease subunit PstC [Thermomicrobiales bacterium]
MVQRGFIEQASAPAVSPLTAAGLPPRQLDLSGGGRRRGGERLISGILLACGSVSILTTVGIVAILVGEAVAFFLDVSPAEFFFGTRWTALFRNPSWGVLPLVLGTLMVTAVAMAVALPVGLMAAIYLSEYARETTRSILKPVLEILAGVPTIVYGYFALTFITPNVLKPIFPNTNVFNALSAGIAVGIMILPMVASLSEDAMRAVPSSLREAAYALGGTKAEVASQVVVPAALSGIVASFILAISRAVGETMIIVIAAGNKPQWGLSFLDEIQAMTSYIVQVFTGEVVRGTTAYQSLFAVGLTLFVMTLLLNIISQALVSRFREVYQ